MKRSKIIFVALLLTLVISSMALAQDNTVERPFRMTSSASVLNEAPSADCPFLDVNVGGTGNATHMGQVTVSRNHCFSPAHDPAFYDGTWEVIAANGDKIWGTYEGNGVPIAFDDQGNPILLQITAPFTIDGGTGRFQGASGSGITRGTLDMRTHAGDFVSEGNITY